MPRLLTSQIASITEMREPHKVLQRAQGEPIAILKNSAVVGYLVPNEAVLGIDVQLATWEEVREHLDRTRSEVQPILDFLRDR
jgi:antitoxin StbD